MRKSLFKKILVTGGAGFIGSEFVRQTVAEGYFVVVVDKLTYAGDLSRLKMLNKGFRFYRADICNKHLMEKIFTKERPQAVINFSAETHVDRSILNPSPFLKTNLFGTQVLMDLSRKYNIIRFIQISTDEVYGEIEKGSFKEDSSLKPNSPYAVSKASADLLVKAYIRTYRFPAIIIRPCNNYGPWQFPEKLIPLVILKALTNQKIPVYAQGENIREWLYVEDCAEGILKILEKGKIGQIYNLGSGQERRNIEVVKLILEILKVNKNMIEFVKDRPGHDLRYRLNSNKVLKEIGWKATTDFNLGLRKTVDWYINHKAWLLNQGRFLT